MADSANPPTPPEDKPEDANENCVGPSSEDAGKASACAGCPNQKLCSSGELRKANPAQAGVDATMSRIGRTVLVLSGKGGVGKSTTSAQLAFALAREGKSVGLLDLDICGPSIPLMLGLNGQEVHQSSSGWSPVYVDVDPLEGSENKEPAELGVMSIGFLMPDPDSAVIWRGPRKNGLIQQFFTSVDWGDLDYLIVDTPPGTSDEHISIVQLLKGSLKPGDGAIIVTTPQEVAMMDVRKELNFCKQTNIDVLGVVENMSTTHLPVSELLFKDGAGVDQSAQVKELLSKYCPQVLELNIELSMFPAANGGPEAMASKFGVPLLGRLPLDAKLQQACESGVALQGGSALGPLREIVGKIIETERGSGSANALVEESTAGVISVSTTN